MDSKEFQATFKQTYELYAKYQIAIHHDSRSDCTEEQVRLFP